MIELASDKLSCNPPFIVVLAGQEQRFFVNSIREITQFPSLFVHRASIYHHPFGQDGDDLNNFHLYLQE